MEQTIRERAAQAAKGVEAPKLLDETAPKRNPANMRDMRVTEANRIPMSTPQLKLAVPDIPGYAQHWFLSQNIEAALRAGYEYVDLDEVEVLGSGYANDLNQQGSTDLGTRVSLEAGRGAEWQGQPGRLYLMKIRQEWRDKDQKILEAKNEEIAQALRGGKDIEANPHGADHKHTPEWAPQNSKAANNLFTRKRR